jgi:hypothetical protein
MKNSILNSLSPGDLQKSDPAVRQAFKAAKRSYPIAVHSLSSTWVLEPNAFDAQRLMLAEYPNENDKDPEPICHWMFQCDLDELCAWCHDGWGGSGLCLRHRIFCTLWLKWDDATWYAEEYSKRINDFLDRHLAVNLTLLTIIFLAMSWALFDVLYLPGHISGLLATFGIVTMALAFLAHAALAIRTWREKRMSEQADNSIGQGDH